MNNNFIEILKDILKNKSKTIRVRSRSGESKRFRVIKLREFINEYKKCILKTKKGSRYIKLKTIDDTLIEPNPNNSKAFEKSIELRKSINGHPF